MNKAVRSLESEFIYVNIVFCGEALVWNSLFLTVWGIINGFCRVLSIEQSKRDVAAHLKRILTGVEGFPLEKEQNLWSCVCISWWKSGMKKLLIMFDDGARFLGTHKSNSESTHHRCIIDKESPIRTALSQPEYIQKIDESLQSCTIRENLCKTVFMYWRPILCTLYGAVDFFCIRVKVSLKALTKWLIHFYTSSTHPLKR
jgi:hypothetical protein